MNKYEIFTDEYWYNRRYDGRRKLFRHLGMSREQFEDAKFKHIKRRFYAGIDETKSKIRSCYEAITECAKPEHGRYQKVVMYGYNHLWLCSPVFGHRDYNKSILMEIKGHEKECAFLKRVSDRVSAS